MLAMDNGEHHDKLTNGHAATNQSETNGSHSDTNGNASTPKCPSPPTAPAKAPHTPSTVTPAPPSQRPGTAPTAEQVWMMCDAAHRGDLQKLKHLKASGLDFNAWDYDNRTALHLAAASGRLDVVKFLMEECGCRLKRDRFGGLPVHDAMRYGKEDVVTYLQDKEFSVCGPGEAETLTSKVVSIVMKEGVFAYSTCFSEVDYFFKLGWNPWYFQHFTAAQIARHIQCYTASKKVALTAKKNTMQFHVETEHSGVYLTTVHTGPDTIKGGNEDPYHLTQKLVTAYMEATPQEYAYGLTYLVSRAPAFPGGSEPLAIFAVTRSPYEQQATEPNEEDIELISTTDFLKSKDKATLKIYSRLINKVLRSSSGAYAEYIHNPIPSVHSEMDDLNNPQFPPKTNKFLIQYGNRSDVRGLRGQLPPGKLCQSTRHRSPVYIQQIFNVFKKMDISPAKHHVQSFANGVVAYHFYFTYLSDELANRCIRQLQLVPFLKSSSPLTELFVKNVIDDEVLLYAYSVIKFAFHFVRKETPEYNELLSRLSDPVNKAKLDSLFLQAMTDVLTEERVFDTVIRHIDLIQALYADFHSIALGKCKPFRNTELEGSLRLIRDDIDVKILTACLAFNEHLLTTNFFRTNTPSAVAYRFDAKFLTGVSKSLFPEIPYGLFMIVGRDFHGFHVRFRDVARGGIRLIKSADRGTYARNAATLFEENYNLAFTQQRKNKDIPEGGSKGTILLNLDAQDTRVASFDKYIDALLDCMMCRSLNIHSHLPDDEILFFGPDENTADLMERGSRNAKRRGYTLWKSLTTGKPPSLGGIPHDVYGMTTRSVHNFKLGLLGELGLDEEKLTKIQIGGPDGDLGSNEILISKDITVAVVDGSGVVYDPKGLQRVELMNLAKKRITVSNFDPALLSPEGFLVLVGDTDVKLPDGTVVERGDVFRNEFHLSKYAVADLFVPCGGRPRAVTGNNVARMFTNGLPKFRCIVEGANLFFTDDARQTLEKAGVYLLKDASCNKGGVTCSSLEVLAALLMNPNDHDALMCVPESGDLPEMYKEYVKWIQALISEKARMEFQCMWRMKVNDPTVMFYQATESLSTKINRLSDIIRMELDTNQDKALLPKVLAHTIPPLLLEKYGVEYVMATLPSNYVSAMVSAWLASTYVYENGFEASEYSFHQFMTKFYAKA